ncbi:duf455 domain containing protein [Grosmannia clavigera kw1407]|uniref:polynucleotide adenylyltransferase n=1 Tax=Grosmannia clavigera (strain kw1407 / UAMH 11150) TaxID=655863 RepID=F0XI48_GROCL|nr:duf455 domain containing protein [Grosmannia clavigera kw1407]EFX02889.1 duf455 domain containing protein [Grosmannia clavigera kw1407]
MLEVSVNGLHVNLQYCQAAVVAETWPAVLVVAADHALITTLSPQTLSRLKATAYRSIKTWARSRGLYAARFGYLGGIQIAVLLARVMKLMAAATDDDDDDDSSAVPDILATFFRDYAGFDWATQMAFDPFFHGHKAPHVRTAGEPLVILGYHRPQLNTSMSASVSSVRVLAAELRRADRLLSAGRISWDAFLGGGGDEGDSSTIVAGRLLSGAATFVCAYRTYVKIDLQYWGLSLQRGASFVGWLESRCAMLLVDVARRLPQLNTHIWPGRFVEGDEGDGEGDDAEIGTETTQYQGCYLIGLDLAASLSRDDRRIALDTLQSVLSTFERQMRRSGGEYDAQWMWLGVSIASRTDLGDVGRLRLDERAWYTSEEEEEEEEEIEEEEARPKKKDKKDKKNKDKDRFKAASQVGTGKKFRSAQDVIKRLRWDPQLDRADYVVRYEDRFVGAQERPLSAWKSEQTDEEFIPQHRVLYFRRRSDGAVIWDRRARKDEVFGSGM